MAESISNYRDSKNTKKKQNMLIELVLTERSFLLMDILEYGHFGPTVWIKNPLNEKEHNVKILEYKNYGENELKWESLINKNILEVLQIEYINEDVVLFYTEVWDYVLKDIILTKLFKDKTDGIEVIMTWFKQIAEGLAYIHSRKFFHMNVDMQNIVISRGRNAKITNFHWICSADSQTKK